MNKLKLAHRKAMDLFEEGLFKNKNGNKEEAQDLFNQAFEIEKNVAISFEKEGKEPTRSILFRSAASIALNAGLIRDAEIMCANGLAGNPPEEIAEELRDLLEQINFNRHMNLRDIDLSPTEFQLSLAGKQVGFGLIRSEEFLVRTAILEQLIYRTAERKEKIKFRESGPIKKTIRENYQQYFSVPRASSFAITLKIGKPVEQLTIPGINLYSEVTEVIDEVLKGIELINNSEENTLKELINDDKYFRNFKSLVGQIAPDGENINLVGFTVQRIGKEKQIPLNKDRNNILSEENKSLTKNRNKNENLIQGEIVGVLDWASEKTKKVKLTTETNERYEVIFKSELSDLVRTYWNRTVKIRGKLDKEKNKMYFEYMDLE